MKECSSCKHFNKFYSKKEEELIYEGVGRCTNESSLKSGFINADFHKCEKHRAKKKSVVI